MRNFKCVFESFKLPNSTDLEISSGELCQNISDEAGEKNIVSRQKRAQSA